MRSNILGVLLFTCLLGLSWAPASAQSPIELEIGAPWTHPHSGIVVPSELGGLQRGSATQFSEDFLNIGFSFSNPDGEDELSLYIYRHTNGGVPVWFRQAQVAIEMRDIYAEPELAFGVEPYGWPGAGDWQGLRAVYAVPNSVNYTSTAVALFSVDGWLVKMRVSSSRRSPEEMAQLIDASFAELTPPEAKMAQSPALAVVDCEEKLRFKRARDAKPDPAAALIGALLGRMVTSGELDKAEESEASAPKPVQQWCRDGEISRTQVAYRADGSKDSYLIAIGDSGIGVSVGPDLSGQLLQPEGGEQDYSITLITEKLWVSYVPQDRLPSLQRVMEILNAERTVSSVSTWGDDTSIQLQSGALDN